MHKQQVRDERKFFQLIEKVGSWGKYQYFMIATFAYTSILQASFMFIPPYLFHQSQYQCQGMVGQQCQNFVCSLEDIQKSQYLPFPPFQSLADDLGDFRCHNKSTLPLLQSIFFMSAIAGMIILTLFTERIGRKNSFQFTSTCTLIGLIVILFSNNLPLLIIGLFITVMGTQNGNQFTNCIPNEIISQSKRVKSILLQNMFYPFGIMVNAIAFSIFHQWKTVVIIFYIIPAFIVFLSVTFIFQKTPIDLLKSQNPERILQILHKIEKINEIQTSQLTLQYVTNLQVDYLNYFDSQQKLSGQFNIFHICKFKSLLKIFIPLSGNLFVAIYLFTSPAMISSNLTTDQILSNNIVSGIAYTLSVVALYFMTQRQDRRTIINYILIGQIFITFLMVLNVIKNNQTLTSILFFLYRCIVSGFIQIMYIINYESYPAQIRATAALFSCAIGMSSGIVQPWIVQYSNNNNIDVRFSFILLGFLGLFSNYYLKQTFKIAPPEIIQQLQAEKNKQFETYQ